jgi:quinol monooxygenase YgiN
MTVSRRKVLGVLAALPLTQARAAAPSVTTTTMKETPRMYGLIGKMLATPGQRDALIAILLEGTTAMPGCLAYIIAKDKQDADAIWITETWATQDNHKASLTLPSVQAAIKQARPLIAGFGERFETEPVGGQGLPNK